MSIIIYLFLLNRNGDKKYSIKMVKLSIFEISVMFTCSALSTAIQIYQHDESLSSLGISFNILPNVLLLYLLYEEVLEY
jgi:hypothetical protein